MAFATETDIDLKPSVGVIAGKCVPEEAAAGWNQGYIYMWFRRKQ